MSHKAHVAQALATAHDFAQLLVSATRYQGLALLWQGHTTGLTFIQREMTALQVMRAYEARATQLTSLAKAHVSIGQAEEGLRQKKVQ